MTPTTREHSVRLEPSPCRGGEWAAKRASDLLWVLPLLTCGHSPSTVLYALVREF
jgi:hypothetical protein